jgi:hypothetical protein
MSDLGHYVCSESVAAERARAIITICELGNLFVASWECSCGAASEEPVAGEATTIAIAVELGRRNYQAHCAIAHC